MKKLNMLLSVIAAVIILSSCSLFPSKKEDVYINCSTGPTSGALYPLGTDLAELWTSKVKYITSEAHTSAGGLENLELLAKGEAEVIMAISRNCFESYTGSGPFEGRPNKNLRVIAGLYYNPNQLVVLNESNINNVRDLYGKEISVGLTGSSTEGEAIYHLQAAGLNYPNDINAHHTNFTDAVNLMKSKTLDGAWIMAGLGNAAVSEACANAGAKIVDIDKDIISKLLIEYPWYSEFTIPAGAYANQNGDVKTTAVKMLMVTTSELDEGTVYDMAKTFWENIAVLTENNPSLADVSNKDALTGLANLPLHPGAEKYYREIGVLD